jgi:hypothetical protein
MELISELRYGVALSDPSALAADLLREARKPMSDAVRRAWFRYHYVEMRSEHRACDGAAERPENPTAMLIGATRTIEHALRAAMVIDGEPYRYGKWLAPLAARTPTGARLVPVVNEAIELIGAGGLRDPAPESAHPLILTLKRLRQPLVEAARAAGADGPWLTEWWLHIDTSRQCVQHVSW